MPFTSLCTTDLGKLQIFAALRIEQPLFFTRATAFRRGSTRSGEEESLKMTKEKTAKRHKADMTIFPCVYVDMNAWPVRCGKFTSRTVVCAHVDGVMSEDKRREDESVPHLKCPALLVDTEQEVKRVRKKS